MSIKIDFAQTLIALAIIFSNSACDSNTSFKNKKILEEKLMMEQEKKLAQKEADEKKLASEITDEKNYKTIEIGDQIWMLKNLNVSTFRNGEPIPEAKTKEDWIKADDEGTPAWCYYDNNQNNGDKYGKLYNWYVINDPRGLAPNGWHVASDKEWETLANKLGGKDNAGAKLKSVDGWTETKRTNNESGFTALAGGSRSPFGGVFSTLNEWGYWWTSSNPEKNDMIAFDIEIMANSNSLDFLNAGKGYGMSVRCIKD